MEQGAFGNGPLLSSFGFARPWSFGFAFQTVLLRHGPSTELRHRFPDSIASAWTLHGAPASLSRQYCFGIDPPWSFGFAFHWLQYYSIMLAWGLIEYSYSTLEAAREKKACALPSAATIERITVWSTVAALIDRKPTGIQ